MTFGRSAVRAAPVEAPGRPVRSRAEFKGPGRLGLRQAQAERSDPFISAISKPSQPEAEADLGAHAARLEREVAGLDGRVRIGELEEGVPGTQRVAELQVPEAAERVRVPDLPGERRREPRGRDDPTGAEGDAQVPPGEQLVAEPDGPGREQRRGRAGD